MKKTYSLSKLLIVLFAAISVRSFSQVVYNESFDLTTFPPSGWTQIATSGSAVWARATSGTNPTQAPHSGAGEAYFNSYNASTGVNSILTPSFSLVNNTAGAQMTFWMYRDAAYAGATYTAEGVSVYYNTTASASGATLLGYIPRCSSNTPTVSANGWYQYGFTIPSTVTNSAVYLIFTANSNFGDNIYMDDISWTGYPAPCSGTPPAAVAAISSSVGCPGVGISLSAISTATGLGISYQWQWSTTSGGTYTNITGANALIYATSTTATTYYKLVTTCSVSAQSAATSVLSYSVNNPGPCVCNSYGPSSVSTSGDEDILQVVFGSLNNISTCTSVGPGPGSVSQLYANYTGFVAAPNVCVGAAVPYTVVIGTCGGWYGVSIGMYIDYNQNGSFADAGDLVYSNTTYSSTANTYVGSITIPTTALVGTTRMRIVMLEGTGGSVPASVGTLSGWGEVEDYCINIQSQPTLSVSANSASICPAGSFTVSASGANTYTWVGGASPLTGATVTLSPIANTVYTVNGTAVNGCVSSGNNSRTTTVTTLTSPTLVTSVSPSTAFCVGQTATLTVTGANTYTWNGTTVSNSLVVNPSTTTQYTIVGTGTTVCNGVQNYNLTVNPLPVVSVNSGTICSGKTFTMTPTGAATYIYAGTSGTVTSAVSPTANASYSVIGISSPGCISAAAAVSAVTVVALPVVSLVSGTTCAGNPITIQQSGANTYTMQGGSNPVTPTVTSNYTVTGTSSVGCVSLPVVTTVTVFALPVLTITPSPNDTICNGQTANLTVTGATSYTWNAAAAGASFSAAPSTSTVYFAYGTDNLGCVNYITQPITVNPLPSVGISNTNTFICAGATASLVATGAPSNSYLWSNTQTTPTVFVTPAATTVYSVTATSTLNCSKTVTTSVTVNTIALTLTSNTAICNGGEVVLTAGGVNTYTWSHNTSLHFAQVTVNPSLTTTYNFVGNDSKNCLHTGAVTVSVNPNPNINVTATQNTICVGETATLTATGANTYSWSNQTTGANMTVTASFATTYNFSVTGTDSKGCMTTQGFALKADKCTGIYESPAIAGFKVYPNPTNGEFVVELSNGLEKEIVISDISGRILVSEKTTKDALSVNINSYAAGIYYVKVTSDKNVEVVRIIKQ
jgi:hypothetical protein